MFFGEPGVSCIGQFVEYNTNWCCAGGRVNFWACGAEFDTDKMIFDSVVVNAIFHVRGNRCTVVDTLGNPVLIDNCYKYNLLKLRRSDVDIEIGIICLASPITQHDSSPTKFTGFRHRLSTASGPRPRAASQRL